MSRAKDSSISPSRSLGRRLPQALNSPRAPCRPRPLGRRAVPASSLTPANPGLVLAARVAPQAAPRRSGTAGRAEPGSALRSPAASPSRPPGAPAAMGALLALCLLLGWLRAGWRAAAARRVLPRLGGRAGQLPRGFPVPGASTRWTPPSAAAARCATAAAADARLEQGGCTSSRGDWERPGITAWPGPKVGQTLPGRAASFRPCQP